MIQKCKKRGSKLTAKQKAAAEHFVLNGDKSAAYRKYYSAKSKPATINKAAHRLFEAPVVKAYVQELQAKSKSAAIIERTEALEMFSAFARADALEPKDRMTALQHLGKLEGWEAAQKIDLTAKVTFKINLTGEE